MTLSRISSTLRPTRSAAFLTAAALTLMTAASAAAQAARPVADRTLSDANIAAIVVVANAADIENGRLALERAADPAVKQFAETMIRDHSAVNAQASALVEKLGVTPQPSDASRGLAAATDAARDDLRELEGAAFDLAYVKNEVAYHRSVLETLDTTLIPSAGNAELKALLTAVRPAFVAHLEHAEQLQASLEG